MESEQSNQRDIVSLYPNELFLNTIHTDDLERLHIQLAHERAAMNRLLREYRRLQDSLPVRLSRPLIQSLRRLLKRPHYTPLLSEPIVHFLDLPLADSQL